MRVYELAKKLDKDSKDILDVLDNLGIKGKSHSSSVTKDVGAKVEELMKAPPAPTPESTPEPKPTPAPSPPPEPKQPPAAEKASKPRFPRNMKTTPVEVVKQAPKPPEPEPEPEPKPEPKKPVEKKKKKKPSKKSAKTSEPVTEGVPEEIIPPPLPDAEGKPSRTETRKRRKKKGERERTEDVDKSKSPKVSKSIPKKKVGEKELEIAAAPTEEGATDVTQDVIRRELQKMKKAKREAKEKETQKGQKSAATQRPTTKGSGGGRGRPKSRDRIRREKRDRFEKAQLEVMQELEKSRSTLRITELTTVGDIAENLGVSLNELIGKLMGMGLMVTKNQRLDMDTINIIADEYSFDVEEVGIIEDGLFDSYADQSPAEKAPRPPVVTVMGHVDHGKTKLLDAIRETDVVAGESGGITQHIGAYHVTLPSGHVVFLDTPGHETFTAMRAHGAMVTDIVVLVIAATEGVMPQTVEAIHHARAAEVPIIVALNKIDLEGANPDKIKQQLVEHGLMAEDWGGKTSFVNISALKRMGIEELLETILLESEMLELKACPSRRATGTVIESRVDRGRGAVATVLVQDGTLKNGDPFVCGVYPGKVRAMLDDKGKPVEEAGPSMPVEVLGLGGVPSSGDHFLALEDEKTSRDIAVKLQSAQREKEMQRARPKTLEDLYSQVLEGKLKKLNLIIKGDVQGSVIALGDGLEKLSSPKISLQVIHSGVGPVGVADVMLASASDALIIGFNVELNPKVAEVAERENVEVRLYRIIYDVINDIKEHMLGLLDKEFVEDVIGSLEVKQVFRVSKDVTIVGGRVDKGKMIRNSPVQILRGEETIYRGTLSNLKRFKDDIKEVPAGLECGMSFTGLREVEEGDIVQCLERREIKQTL